MTQEAFNNQNLASNIGSSYRDLKQEIMQVEGSHCRATTPEEAAYLAGASTKQRRAAGAFTFALILVGLAMLAIPGAIFFAGSNFDGPSQIFGVLSGIAGVVSIVSGFSRLGHNSSSAIDNELISLKGQLIAGTLENTPVVSFGDILMHFPPHWHKHLSTLTDEQVEISLGLVDLDYSVSVMEAQGNRSLVLQTPLVLMKAGPLDVMVEKREGINIPTAGGWFVTSIISLVIGAIFLGLGMATAFDDLDFVGLTAGPDPMITQLEQAKNTTVKTVELDNIEGGFNTLLGGVSVKNLYELNSQTLPKKYNYQNMLITASLRKSLTTRFVSINGYYKLSKADLERFQTGLNNGQAIQYERRSYSLTNLKSCSLLRTDECMYQMGKKQFKPTGVIIRNIEGQSVFYEMEAAQNAIDRYYRYDKPNIWLHIVFVVLLFMTIGPIIYFILRSKRMGAARRKFAERFGVEI